MKTKKLTQLLTLAFCAVAFAFVTSCEGPQGPAGIAGADGTNGTNGTNGIDGIDANETCKDCHNSNTLIVGAQQQQFATGGHANGTYYNRSGECSGCHNNEGFNLRVANVAASTDEWDLTAVDPQTQISCYTCHTIHSTFTTADWGFTHADQVTTTLFGMADATDDHVSYSLPDVGSANLCLQCHQSRDRGGVPTATSTADVTISSSHWGPHYGIQGQVLYAFNTAGPAGTKTYPTEGVATSGHASLDCISCHMPDGNHSLEYDYDNCTVACHSNDAAGLETKHGDLETEIHDDLFALGALLAGQGAMSVNYEDDGVTVAGYSPVSGFVASAAQARAVWNYMTVYQDHSYGTHNPAYIRALLANSTEEVTP